MKKSDALLDARGLACPLPLLKAKKMLVTMTRDQLLQVVSTDPSSVDDFLAFAKITDHQLVDFYETEGAYYFFIRKK